MTEQSEPLNSREKPCVICGSTEYSWGSLVGPKVDDKNFVYFREQGSTWEDGDQPTFVRHCKRCNNIQIFAD